MQSSEAPDGSTISVRAIPRRWTGRSLAADYALPIAFILLVIFFASQSDTFLSLSNAQNVARQSSVTAIAAVGISVLFIGGGIDISQGAVMVATGLVAVWLANMGLPPAVVILGTLLLGVMLGLLNALFAEIVGIPALIATLGTSLVIRGMAFVTTDGRSLSLEPEFVGTLDWLGRGDVLGVPIPTLIAVILVALVSIALRYTVWGQHTFAIGGSPEAAEAVGIRTSRHRQRLYALGGATSALAGLILVGRLTAAAPGNLPNAEFDVITAAVLGGVSIYGGAGRLSRVLLAALFVAALSNGLVQLNVPSFWTRVVTGVVFLGALSLDRFKSAEGR